MACSITQADLGPVAEALTPEAAQFYIDAATVIVLGPVECQVENQLAWLGCCVDPCAAIKWLAGHMIAADPSSGSGSLQVVARRVGDVSRTYANASSSSGVFGGSFYGQQYAFLLAQFEICQGSRRTTGTAYGGSCGCL